ncbi:MAG: hypothetical protein ACLRPR_05795 [Eisenbergiella sp.]
MISEQYRKMLAQKSVIRQLSEAASRRAAQIGAENVFDYSLGNPSVPAPKAFTGRCVPFWKTVTRWRCTATARRWEFLP